MLKQHIEAEQEQTHEVKEELEAVNAEQKDEQESK